MMLCWAPAPAADLWPGKLQTRSCGQNQNKRGVVSLCNLVRRYSRGKIANRDNMIISRFVRVICLYLKSAADATSKSAEINTNHGSSLAAAVPDTCFSGICEGFAWFSLTTNIDPASEAPLQLVTKLYYCPHVHMLMVRSGLHWAAPGGGFIALPSCIANFLFSTDHLCSTILHPMVNFNPKWNLFPYHKRYIISSIESLAISISKV